MKLIKFNEDKIYNEFRFVKGCVYELENNFAFRWIKRGCVEVSKEEMKKLKVKLSKDPRVKEEKKAKPVKAAAKVEAIKEEKAVDSKDSEE